LTEGVAGWAAGGSGTACARETHMKQAKIARPNPRPTGRRPGAPAGLERTISGGAQAGRFRGYNRRFLQLRQFGEVGETEVDQESRRCGVEDWAAGCLLPPGFADQAALQQRLDDPIAAHPTQ